MAWACMAANGTGSLIFINITANDSIKINSAVYRNILSAQVQANIYKISKLTVQWFNLQQDNDSKHTDKGTKGTSSRNKHKLKFAVMQAWSDQRRHPATSYSWITDFMQSLHANDMQQNTNYDSFFILRYHKMGGLCINTAVILLKIWQCTFSPHVIFYDKSQIGEYKGWVFVPNIMEGTVYCQDLCRTQ